MAKITLATLLKTMVEQGASDLHLSVGVPPEFRIQGKVVKVKTDPLTPQDTKELCYSILTEVQKSEFEKHLELDFSFGLKELSRFRGNIFSQRGSVSGVFRRVPLTIPELESAGLPSVLGEILRRPNGLVLVTGATGSGKSTTVAAMIDYINRHENGHIITIEDPIEFVHPHKNCIVNQREVGIDTRTFGSAMRRLLRQDPDFVMVGELRDTESIEMALTMAETGHLVFSTLHTNNAVQSINRLINSFSPHQQPQIRQVLSFTLQAVISQQLIPKSYEPGRVLVAEVLVPTQGIRNQIREDKLHQIYSSMQAGQEQTGMQTMNQALLEQVRLKTLSSQDALDHSNVPEELEKMLAAAGIKGAG